MERNFPEAKSVRAEDRAVIGKAFVKIASKYGMVLKLCAEGEDLAKYGADCSGCMTVHTLRQLSIADWKFQRERKIREMGNAHVFWGQI